MRIYVAHSRAFDFKAELYTPLQKALGSEHQLILPHAVSEEPYPSRDLFDSKGCDAVIAEVSFPSTGLGIELGWADSRDIPVFGVHRTTALVSGSLLGVCNAIVPYEGGMDIGVVVQSLLKDR